MPTNDAVIGSFVSRGDDFLQLKNAAGSILAGIDASGTGYGALQSGGGSGTPGGSDGQLQFNQAEAFAGVPGFTTDVNGNLSLTPTATGTALSITQFDDSSEVLSAQNAAGDSFSVSLPAGVVSFFGEDSAGDEFNFDLASGTASFLLSDSAGGQIGIATASGVTSLSMSDASSAALTISPSAVGFFSATPVSQPTVTGSKGGNVALASLIAAFVSLGLIVDNTT